MSEMMSAGVYKRNQGRLVRQLTCLTVWVVIALGCWRLYETLKGDERAWLVLGVPGALLLVGLWVGYRLVNWPRFADFLIAVEAEMNKVSWPSKTEMIRSSVVVIFTIFFLAIALFGFDLAWQWMFEQLGVAA
nr:preprotein translocase subunit SecE [Roseimaritima sediminicola]